jgi:hypothetical protein
MNLFLISGVVVDVQERPLASRSVYEVTLEQTSEKRGPERWVMTSWSPVSRDIIGCNAVAEGTNNDRMFKDKMFCGRTVRKLLVEPVLAEAFRERKEEPAAVDAGEKRETKPADGLDDDNLPF